MQIETQLVNNNENIQFNVVDFPGTYTLKMDSFSQI